MPARALTPRYHLPRLRHVLAPNPSPLTFTGTNSYILGSGRVAVIDPGPDDDDHLAALLATLDRGEKVSHILVTHPHRDHSALAPRLSKATGAPVYGFGTATEGRSPVMQRLAAAGLPAAPGDGLDHGFAPDVRLADKATVGEGDWSVSVLHTPGHLGTHVCLGAGDTLFSGDHVMGWSTSVVSPPDGDMGAYMASLESLAQSRWSRFLPGHGAAIDDPDRRLRDLVAHRRLRESQILLALADGPQDAAALTARVYPDLAPALHAAARRNVLAHLIDLAEKSRITAPDPANPEATFSMI